MIKLEPQQENVKNLVIAKLQDKKICCLSGQMRVGKTFISLFVANELNIKSVLFITKKSALYSVKNDFNMLEVCYDMTATNYEQLHHVKNGFEMIIIDESHSIGAFPKSSLAQKRLKELIEKYEPCYILLMSGTPTPESFSQMYHQFQIWEKKSPFKAYKNFYKFANDYVEKYEKNYGGRTIVQYDKMAEGKKNEIEKIIDDYFVPLSQKDAGFKHCDIAERVIDISINEKIYVLAEILVRDRYFKFKDGNEIVCDTAVKLQNKLHQIFSGSVICENGATKYLDYSKVNYIKENYSREKIAIFYKFQAEREMLIKAFGDKITSDPIEFKNDRYKIFISQIQAGAMGVDLSSADRLIFLNIDFSSKNYIQARARIQSKFVDKIPKVDFIFAKKGIESKIYEAVKNKQSYTSIYFRRDYLNNKRRLF